MHAIRKISPPDVMRAGNCIILDVRTGIEHRTQALKQSHIHVPLDQLDAAAFIKTHNLDSGRPLYILCRAGARAAQAAGAFHAAGFDNVYVIDGGIVNCETCGIATKKGQGISLERQVRIAVGVLVLSGVILGQLFSPWFYVVPAFCGAGLVVAGVTEWCGMAMLLARAPWNRAARNKGGCNT